MITGPKLKETIRIVGDLEDLVISGTNVAYSKAFNLQNYVSGCISLLASGTTVKLKVELEQSFQLPETPCAADDYWEVPASQSDIVSALADKTIQHYNPAPYALEYGRLKVTGLAGGSDNTDDVTLKAWLSTQEEI